MTIVEIFGLLILGMLIFFPFTIIFNKKMKETVLKERDKKTPKK